MKMSAFVFYDPYLSFADDASGFLTRDGKQIGAWQTGSMVEHDAMIVWRFGKKVFDEFGGFDSREDFVRIFQLNISFIESLRDLIKDRAKNGGAIFKDQDGNNCFPDIDEISHSTLVDLAWQMTADSPGEEKKFFGGLFLFLCLIEIDNVILGMFPDSWCSVPSMMTAMEHFANYQAIKAGNENLQKVRSEDAANRAIQRWKDDPTQKAKAQVKEYWESWQALDQDKRKGRYRSAAAFARDMLDKFPVLTNQNVIEGWCTDWKRVATDKQN